MEVATLKVEGPLDLAATLRPLGGRFLADGWWRPMRTPHGPATLHLRRRAGLVEAKAYGPGAGWAAARLPDLVGADDDPAAFSTDHPLVAELARRHRGWRMGRTRLVFEALLVAIVAQKVTGREAGAGLRALCHRFSDPAPGPLAIPLPPDPARLSQAPYYELHPLGIEKRRADIIRAAAKESRRLEGLVDSAEAQSFLQRLSGVGPWTAAETVAVSHGDPDAVSVGDFHLKNEVVWHLAGRPRGTDAEMLELLEPFRPHRGRVVRLLSTLGPAPAFGPRQQLRAINHI